MAHTAEHYARLSDEEITAADEAVTLEERIAHLENAVRLAQRACAERREVSNVFKFSSERQD